MAHHQLEALSLCPHRIGVPFATSRRADSPKMAGLGRHQPAAAGAPLLVDELAGESPRVPGLGRRTLASVLTRGPRPPS